MYDTICKTEQRFSTEDTSYYDMHTGQLLFTVCRARPDPFNPHASRSGLLWQFDAHGLVSGDEYDDLAKLDVKVAELLQDRLLWSGAPYLVTPESLRIGAV